MGHLASTYELLEVSEPKVNDLCAGGGDGGRLSPVCELRPCHVCSVSVGVIYCGAMPPTNADANDNSVSIGTLSSDALNAI